MTESRQNTVPPPLRFTVHLANLNPTVESEMQKTRPCVIVSPNDMNRTLATVVVAPMTSSIRPYPFRVHCHFDNKDGQVALDQMRVLDKSRLLKRLGTLNQTEQEDVLSKLAAMFAP